MYNMALFAITARGLLTPWHIIHRQTDKNLEDKTELNTSLKSLILIYPIIIHGISGVMLLFPPGVFQSPQSRIGQG